MKRRERRRPWRRLAALRASRRRLGEPPPLVATEAPEPLPPLVCPDDDREFVLAWPMPAGIERPS